LTKLLSVAFLLLICWAVVQASLYSLDHYTFEGCTVIGYEDSGRTLLIEIDPKIDNGTDSGCLAASRIILSICQQGFAVRYWDRKIELAEAMALVAGGGGPVSEEAFNQFIDEANAQLYYDIITWRD